MYLADEQIERNILRQGDIISGIHIAGAINLNSIRYEIDISDKKIAWTVPQEPKLGDVMVLSHSCEIDPSNKTKLTSIILAPIRDLNKITDNRKREELIETNLINDSTTMSYLKYFYLLPNPMLTYQDGAVVDFSKCFSVRNKCYDLLVKNKLLQLKTELADQMALKLAIYFRRVEVAS